MLFFNHIEGVRTKSIQTIKGAMSFILSICKI
jgi:hypothetical protein